MINDYNYFDVNSLYPSVMHIVLSVLSVDYTSSNIDVILNKFLEEFKKIRVKL